MSKWREQEIARLPRVHWSLLIENRTRKYGVTQEMLRAKGEWKPIVAGCKGKLRSGREWYTQFDRSFVVYKIAYDMTKWFPELTASEHQELLREVTEMLPELLPSRLRDTNQEE